MFPNMGQIFSKMMRGGGNEADPQKAAASRVTASGKPSLLQMQEGMGGLLTNDGMKQAATGLLGDVSGDFKSAFNDIGSFATNIFGSNPATAFFGQATGQPAQQPAQMIPEQGIMEQPLDPYEARLQELMSNRGWTRDMAIANQASALKRGGDFNNDGAVTNAEWAQWQKQSPQAQPPQTPPAMAPGQFQGANITPEQIASIKRFGGGQRR